MKDFVDAILDKNNKAKAVVLGDINDFEFSETTDILEADVMMSLVKTLPANERYSYAFEGNFVGARPDSGQRPPAAAPLPASI